ncbi:hypothetical protein ABIG06_002763 [Bradyrhizobium sp. USDA 326]|uniref:hypothetical protein n=1 Tax=unclassified Bradyrhizobium TaxID=2631580 RepID=UPI003513A1D7
MFVGVVGGAIALQRRRLRHCRRRERRRAHWQRYHHQSRRAELIGILLPQLLSRTGATAALEECVYPPCAHIAPSLVTVLRKRVRAGGGECEVHHMHIAALALLLRAAGGGLSRTTAMTMRRMMSWWFRFVVSGRFFDRFLSLPRAPRA